MRSNTRDRAQLEAQFQAALAPHFRLEELENHPASVFGLSPDYRIVYVNAAWRRFAHENGASQHDEGWGIGTHYLQAMAKPLQPFYTGLLQRAIAEPDSMHPIAHVYECSSATLFRQFRMQLYALREKRGFVVVNTLAIEAPHDPNRRAEHAPERARYTNANGLIVQCAHCRLVERATTLGTWDWVPRWVEQSPPETTHGICPVCLDYYYPEMAA